MPKLWFRSYVIISKWYFDLSGPWFLPSLWNSVNISTKSTWSPESLVTSVKYSPDKVMWFQVNDFSDSLSYTEEVGLYSERCNQSPNFVTPTDKRWLCLAVQIWLWWFPLLAWPISELSVMHQCRKCELEQIFEKMTSLNKLNYNRFYSLLAFIVILGFYHYFVYTLSARGKHINKYLLMTVFYFY